MITLKTTLAGAAIALLTTTAAMAECMDKSASGSTGSGSVTMNAPHGGTGSVGGTRADGSAAGTNRVSKDGTMAPLQTDKSGSTTMGATGSGSAATGATGTGSAQGRVAKDGSNMPLAGQNGGSPDVATSGQDVQSQQHGGKTAAQAGRTDC
ncbi:hypothetical protein [Prosthecomicrobium sp. N25]|uniref:hypothetical protein n=1 Tax=Prosthecomicrobium sp. N25 TaxID=3129254 RepID=UPI0030786592